MSGPPFRLTPARSEELRFLAAAGAIGVPVDLTRGTAVLLEYELAEIFSDVPLGLSNRIRLTDRGAYVAEVLC